MGVGSTMYLGAESFAKGVNVYESKATPSLDDLISLGFYVVPFWGYLIGF